MADEKSAGLYDATRIQPTIGGRTVDKYRQAVAIVDPDVEAARLRLALVDGNYRLPVTLPLAQHTNDFWLEVARGNIPGFAPVNVVGRNPNVGTVFEDIWDAGGMLTYPTAGETWEIVSASANDTSAGTGARTVLITYLDDAYVEQTETKTLNGTTPVTFTATDAFRFRRAVVTTWGSTIENQGTITIRVSGGGDTRGAIDRDVTVVGDENGLNNSLDTHFTVPAGKTIFALSFVSNTSKNHDVTVRPLIRFFGSEGFETIIEQANYQSSFEFNVNTNIITFPEKSDFKVIARSNNSAVPVGTALRLLQMDN